MYEFISKILPRRTKENYKNLFSYSDMQVRAERFIGFIILFGLGFGFAIAFDLFVIFGLGMYMFLTAFIIVFIVFEITAYMFLWFSVEARAKFTESVLPDVLQLMAMNIKSGLTTDRALLLSARPEFGPLESELRKAGKEIIAGTNMKTALLGISKRIKSELMERTIKLIVEGVESGGEMANLLEQTSADIQKTRLIENEVKATVLMYAIFIFFAAGIGVPLVFGISTHLVEVLTAQMSHFDVSGLSEIGAGQSQFMSLKFSKVSIGTDFLILYSLISLIITSIFGGMIIGLIKEGKEKAGFKFIPILLVMSVVLFFATRIIVKAMFGF